MISFINYHKIKMVQKLVLPLLFLSVSVLSAHAQNWVKQDLYGIATISFSGTPEAETQDNMRAYNFLSDNGLQYVVVQQMDMLKDLPDSEIDNFYNGFIGGFLGSLDRESANDTKPFKAGKYEGRSFSSVKDGAVDYLHYHRVILIGDVVIVYNYALLEKENDTIRAEKDAFFNSFSLKN